MRDCHSWDLWTRRIIEAMQKGLGESLLTGIQKSAPTCWSMEALPVEEAIILNKNHSILHIFKASVTEFWDSSTVTRGRNPSEMSQTNATNAATAEQLFWSGLFFWHALISHPPIVVGLLCYNFSERMMRTSQKNPVWYALLSYRFLDINIPLPSKLSALHTGRPQKCPFFLFPYSIPSCPRNIFLLLTAMPNPFPLHFQLLQLNNSQELLYTDCHSVRESKSQAFLLASAVWSYSRGHGWVLWSVTLGCWQFNQDTTESWDTLRAAQPARKDVIIFGGSYTALMDWTV